MLQQPLEPSAAPAWTVAAHAEAEPLRQPMPLPTAAPVQPVSLRQRLQYGLADNAPVPSRRPSLMPSQPSQPAPSRPAPVPSATPPETRQALTARLAEGLFSG